MKNEQKRFWSDNWEATRTNFKTLFPSLMSQAAREVKNDAEATMLEAQNQNDRADDLADDAMETMMRLNAIEAQADADGDLAHEVTCMLNLLKACLKYIQVVG